MFWRSQRQCLSSVAAKENNLDESYRRTNFSLNVMHSSKRRFRPSKQTICALFLVDLAKIWERTVKSWRKRERGIYHRWFDDITLNSIFCITMAFCLNPWNPECCSQFRMKTCTGSHVEHCTEDLVRHLKVIVAIKNAEKFNENLFSNLEKPCKTRCR